MMLPCALWVLCLAAGRVMTMLPGRDHDPRITAREAALSIDSQGHRYNARTAPQFGNRTPGCQRLLSAYPGQVFFTGSTNYTFENEHYWSTTTVLEPKCVFAPESAEDLAGGLLIIVKTNTTFALRSGGHMPVTGYANTNDGVLIATSNLDIRELAPTPNEFDVDYLKLGPANRWGETYFWLDDRDLVVYGGRVTTVGSSLLLGGGLSYLSSEGGWACNMIVNFELVTADGQILQVNQGSHPDLFWALKGGSNNFGIVTRYDIKTFPRGPLYGGTAIWPKEQVAAYLAAHTAYQLPGGGADDPKSAIMPDWSINPLTGDQAAAAVLFYDEAVDSPKALENFTAIPSTLNNVKIAKMGALTNTTAAFGALRARQLWRTTAIKINEDTMTLINDTLINVAYTKLATINATIGAAVEPITEDILIKAQENGGDAIDLDPMDGRFVVVLFYANYPYSTDDVAVTAGLDFMLDDLNSKAKESDMHYPFIFLNDAGEGQKPFETYGKGKSLPKMLEISKKYDPSGAFQRLVKGFKLV